MASRRRHTTSCKSKLHRDEDVIPLQSLPKELPPASSYYCSDLFSISTTLAVVHPRSLLIKSCDITRSQRAAIEMRPKIVCETKTTIFISQTQHFVDILDQLATHAQSAFGINISDRWRWGCALVVEREDTSGTVTEENAALFISAASQGGWGWRIYIAELERSPRGIWESRTSIMMA